MSATWSDVNGSEPDESDGTAPAGSESREVEPEQRPERGPDRGAPLLLAASALIILVTVFSLTSDVFLTTTNMTNLLRQMSVLLVVALAGTFVIMLGSIDLSVGSTVTLGGITTAMAMQAFGLPGVLLTLLAGAIAGLVNGILHAGFRLPSFLVTLGMLSVINGAALILSGGSPKPLPRSVLDDVMGGTVFGVIPMIAVWALGIWAVMWFVAARTVFGRQVVAIGDGERVAALSGIPVRRIKIVVFTLSGLLAATGGLLLAVRTSSGSPGMGDVFLLDSIAAIVIGGTALTGGIGGPARTLLGALTITVLSNGMTLLAVDPFNQVVIRGVVVIAAVLLTIRRNEFHLIK